MMHPEEPTESNTATEPAGGAGIAPRLVLESFEGPLDLLLHLIRSNRISISDIPISEICRQYESYLGLMQELNLEVAGEYLVMAATLAHIKSRMLLPAPPAAAGEEPEDPRAELVRQLVEYQKAKAAAELLRDYDELQADTFQRGHGGEDPLEPYRDESTLEVSLFDLLTAFRRLVETLANAAPLHVQRDEISVAEKIAWLMDRLESTPAARFDALVLELPTRGDRIAAFLAILELIRLRLIRATQDRPFGEIMIHRAAASDEEGDARSGEDDDA